MSHRLPEILKQADLIKEIAARHKGLSVSVFGSVARMEDGPESDVDFLVDFGKGSSLFDILHVKDELEELLNCPVDVICLGGLKDRDVDIRADAILL